MIQIAFIGIPGDVHGDVHGDVLDDWLEAIMTAWTKADGLNRSLDKAPFP